MLVAPQASHAQDSSPVSAYLRLCEIINRADRDYTAGAKVSALADYLAAEKAIQELQAKYPGWNVNPVSLRLFHVTERLKALAASPRSAESAPGTVATARPAPAEPALTPSGANATNDLRTALNELRTAQSDNAMLLARLKEALAVRPTAVDPIELRRAEEQVRALQKENDRLRSEIEAPAKNAATTSGGNAETKRLRQDLDKVNLQLQAQSAAAVSLLADKNLKIEVQSRQIDNFAKERATLESRLKTAATSNPTIAELRGENTTLKQQLQSMQALSPNATTQTAETKRQLETAQVRLAASGIEVESLRQTNATLLKQLAAVPTQESLARLAVENAALKRQLAEAASPATSVARATELEKQVTQARSEIALLNQRLTTAPTSDAISKLTAENQNLRQQLAAVPTKAQPAAATQTRLAAAESAFKTTKTENAALRQQLDASQKTATLQAARARQFEQQLAELQTRFAEADRQLSSRSAKKMESQIQSLNEDLLALRARIRVYESKAIPYTKEELALFRAASAAPVVAQGAPAGNRPTTTIEVSTDKLMAAAKPVPAGQTSAPSVRSDERDARAFYNLALSQADLGRYPEAEQNARKALAISANDPASLGVLGRALASQNRFDEALDPLSRAATLKPKDAGLQTLLGITLAQKGQRTQAETAFRKALQADSANADAHRNLAVIYLTQQPPLVELARWHYQKSLIYGAAASPEIESKLGPSSGGAR
jgi:hypothetical protein